MSGDVIVKLDKKHLKNILDNGFSYYERSPGDFIKITADDLLFDKKEIHEFEKSEAFKKMKKENNK